MNKNIIRIISTLIIIASVLFINAFADEATTHIYNNDDDFKYAVSDDYIWIATSKNIKIMDPLLEKVLTSFEISHDAEHIAAYGNSIYIHYYEDSEQYIAIYDVDGNTVDSVNLDPEMNITYFEVEGQYIFIMAGNSDFDDEHNIQNSMIIIDTNDNSISLFGDENAYSAFAVNRDTLAVYNFYESTISFYNIRTGEFTGEHYLEYASYFDMTDDGSLFILGSDEAAENGRVYLADVESGKLSIIYSADSVTAGLRAGNGYLYTKGSEHRLYAIPATVPETDENVLTIGCFIQVPDNYQNIEEAFKLTEKALPGITFEFIVYDNEEAMLTDAMAGESGIDIYFIPDFALLNAANLYRAGAICDLRDIPAVMENYGQLIDITEIMSCDGAVVAVPQTMIPTAVEVNLPLFEEYGLSVPRFDWTWQDFFELAAQVEQLREEGCDVFLVHDAYEPIPVHQYVITGLYDGRLDLDTEEFRYVMENWKYYIDCGVIMPAYEAGSVFSIPENALLYAGEVGHVNFTAKTNSGEAAYVLLPGYGTAGNTLVRRELVCMSSRAQNPEAAAVFMANCIDISIYSDELFYENEGNLLADFSVLETVREESRYPMSYPTTENSLIWRELMESGIYDWHNMPFEIFFDWYIEYINGEISIDEYIFKSQERIDMVLGE